MPTLDEFIRREVASRGWTYAELARRTRLPRSSVHKLATHRLRRTPEPRTLEALARGLDVPVAEIQARAAESLGFALTIENGPGPDASVITASIERLSAEDRRHVLALVASLLGADHGEKPTA